MVKRHGPINIVNVIGLLQRQRAGDQRGKQMIAWKAQQRCTNVKAMARQEESDHHCVGRELLGFIWAIAIETEKQHKLAKAA
jgi:hypothetical protein